MCACPKSNKYVCSCVAFENIVLVEEARVSIYYIYLNFERQSLILITAAAAGLFVYNDHVIVDDSALF